MQSRCALIVLTVVALVAGLAHAAEKTPRAALQGTWLVTGFTMSGKSAPSRKARLLKIVFTGDTMKLSGMGERTYKIKIDPSTTPGSIDLTAKNGPFKDKVCPAIFQFDGDNLKLCLPFKEGQKRPKAMEAPEGSGMGLFVLKRS